MVGADKTGACVRDVQILDFVAAKGARYPCVLGQESAQGELKLVMDAEALKETSKDHERFLARLARDAKEAGLGLQVEGVKE